MKMNMNNNFFHMVLNKKWKKVFLVFVLLILCVVITYTFSVNMYNVQIKNVEFESSGWESQSPGSWHIDKSADWIGIRKARVTFDVDTVIKYSENKKDIILILDNSASMQGEKINKLRTDAIQLVEYILNNDGNRVSLISFNTTAQILSEFTDNMEKIKNEISSLDVSRSTSYTRALKAADEVLNNYEQKDNTDLEIVFLSDGYPTIDNPGQVTEYEILKEKFPYLTISTIQYEMGDKIIKELEEISDKQYSAYMKNLSDILFDVAVPTQTYDKFIVSDVVDERYFELGTIENVNVSIGEANLVIEDGKEKIIWDLGKDFKTGAKATMTLDLKLKDNVDITDYSIFPTNRKEDVEYKIPDEPEDKVESDKTPKLKGAYRVIYNANIPPDVNCTVVTPKTETYFATETATLNTIDLSDSCPGYLFKGWEMTDSSSIDITKINDESFIMPSHDVYIYGTWTKLSISKSMNGEERVLKYVMPFNGEEGFLDNTSSVYVANETGIDFKVAPSTSNGQGLYVRSGTEKDEYPIFYYRGAVTNNNVLFADKCWKVLRTTETGGTKLVYNGIPNEENSNGICANTGVDSQLDILPFNAIDTDPSLYNGSLRDAGYMYGMKYMGTERDLSLNLDSNIIFGSDVEYVNGKYVLKDTISSTWSSYKNLTTSPIRKYTCFTNSSDCGDSVYYITVTYSRDAYYITLTSGKKIEDAITEMQKNTYSSTIKDYLDNWFSSKNGLSNYSGYLEDTVWCNDRSILDINSKILYFGATGRNEYDAQLINPAVKNVESCPNKNDRFTVNDTTNGNGDLLYPIGLITIDEATLAGNGTIGSSLTSYLTSGSNYWTLSPSSFYGDVSGYYVTARGYSNSYNFYYDYDIGVRPSVSLKQGISVSSGDGSVSNPYRVD